MINNQAAAPTSLYVYNVESTATYTSASWLDTFKGYVDQAKTTGVTYLAFELYFHSAMFATSTEPGVIGADLDLTKMDALFDYAYQEGIYLLPTIWVSSPPEWWAALHQDALQLGYGQSSPPTDVMSIAVSYNNPDYWSVMDSYVTTVVQRYRSHPALLGWSPCVGMTRENNYGPSYLSNPGKPVQSWADYSSYAKNRFRTWLTGKYGSDSALRTAWNNPVVTLATAGSPTPVAGMTTIAQAANSAGDTRPSMTDWLAFRLDEKGKEWDHFITLVKTLDPGHVLSINPAGALLASSLAIAQNGTADGLAWTRFPQVDMVRIHPRITSDETPTIYNTQSYTLFAFAAAARRAGKVATFALEDNGEAANNGTNTESLDRIRSLSTMLAAAGSGIGWSIEAGGKLPVWSGVELAAFATYTHLFDPSQRSVTVPTIALLLDPKIDQPEYSLGMNSRSHDRAAFYESLYNAGISLDTIEVAEIIADPTVLNAYSVIVLADMARLDNTAAQLLHTYAQNGGKLFIAGRNGIFNSAGSADYSAFMTLAGLNALPTSDTVSYATWTFDASSDTLLTGISGQTVDTANPFSLLSVDWAANGYTALGHAAASGTQQATLLKKGNSVIWLPRLDPTNSDLIVSLFENWVAGPNSIGFVGCSLSINAVNGYRASGGTQLWPGGSTGYAGGSLSAWVSQLTNTAQAGSYWSKFGAMLSAYPNPRAIWWELCPDANTASVAYNEALATLNQIKLQAPHAKVYVTGVPIYPLDSAHCSINTDTGSQATLNLASQLVANGAALQGPLISALTSTQVSTDGCHANTAGEGIWGSDLFEFFGK